MEKLPGIQVARAVAVLFVVVYHISVLSVEYADGVIYEPAVGVLQGGVDIFFVISGVIMVITTVRSRASAPSAGRFLERRLTRIYPPYLIITVLLAAYWFVNPGFANRSQGGVDFLSSFTLLPSRRLPLLPVAWTLSYEVYFYIVFAMLLGLRANFIAGLGIWGLCTAAGYAFVAAFTDNALTAEPYLPFLVSPFVLEFISGCIIGLVFDAPVPGRARYALAAFSVIFVLDLWAFHAWRMPDDIPVGLRVFMLGTAAWLLVFALSRAVPVAPSSLGVRILARIGEISYSLYLLHILVIHAAYRFVWPRLHVPGNAAVFGALAFCASVAASEVFYRFVEVRSIAAVRRRIAGIGP